MISIFSDAVLKKRQDIMENLDNEDDSKKDSWTPSKVYQVIEHCGDGIDNNEIIMHTYISLRKALVKHKELTEELEKAQTTFSRCIHCSINYFASEDTEAVKSIYARTEKKCKDAKLEIIKESDRSNYNVIICDNNTSWCEDINGYSIVDYDIEN